jgi:hypothetical protein
MSTLAGVSGLQGAGTKADDGVGVYAKFTNNICALCLSNDQSQWCLSQKRRLSHWANCVCVGFADTLYVVDNLGALWYRGVTEGG